LNFWLLPAFIAKVSYKLANIEIFLQNPSPIPDKKRIPSHFPPQRLSPNLHAAEGEPFLAQVLQRGPDMIDGVVDAEEALVGVSEKPLFFLY
jgi:hypothetical protein